MSSVPERGDFVILNFDPQAGHEQAGRRTGIVLSPKLFNESTGFAVICPITNQEKDYPYEVKLPEEGIPVPGGSPVTGVILVDQERTLDWRARRIRILRSHEDDEQILDIIDECLAKIATFLT
ncbi:MULTISPECIES: type II toxin-antitoxin system PemK/MazF family toxin [Bacillus]|nr:MULTISPECIES: type II toxin-antitoxin system PemK/MazF family toxin [Bacillus]TSI09257.1 toxin MazF [Bacillus sp. HY001]